MTSSRRFDGVVCFGGEDWWYHNRGHYDMQMMRELSHAMPVLYVNSIGMRVPRMREGRMFFRRVARKLKSVRHGYERVRDRFAVLSPVAVPGRLGRALSQRLMHAQIDRGARRLSIAAPLLWVACPPAARSLDRRSWVGVVYQRTDRFECFPGVDRAEIERHDRTLKARADLTLFCSRALFDAEAQQCACALFVDHGVDYDVFAAAGQDLHTEPDDLRAVPRPRVGFVGGIDAHTFDPELFLATASALSDVQFVLVGACSLPAGWCSLANVTLLGQRPYQAVPRYMAACDVLIMPWNRSPWIDACNPVKLKEYLAVGRPVVSTGFRELRRYAALVHEASGAEQFARAIRTALAQPGDAQARRQRVESETWSRKSAAVLARLAALGLSP
ncbi:MAG: glycosyltransferase [Planctomycetota bacterium]